VTYCIASLSFHIHLIHPISHPFPLSVSPLLLPFQGALILKEGSRVRKFYILNEGNARVLKNGDQIGDQAAGT
jgi:hypothetical protein